MPKRKADAPVEEDGGLTGNGTSSTPKTKKSKKERIEEAIAKAKKDMEEDKKKVQKTIQSRLAEGKTVTANIKTQIPSKPKPAATGNVKSPAAVSAKTPSKTAARSSASTKTPPTVKSLPDPLAAAKASPNLISLAPAPAPVATMPPQAYPTDLSLIQYQLYQQAMAQAGAYRSPFYQQQLPTGAFIDPFYRQMSPLVMPQAGPAPPATLPQVPTTTTVKAAPAPSKPNAPAAVKKKKPPSKPVAHSDEEDTVPSPPHLQQQVSMQVLENLQASLQNRPSPHTQPPPLDMLSLQQAGITQAEIDAFDPNYEDSDPINMENTPTPRAPSFTKWLSGVVALAAIISALLAGETPTAPSSVIAPSILLQQQCFLDTEPRFDVYVDARLGDDGGTKMNEERVLLNPCEQAATASTCPDLGYCSEGLLVRCTHDDFEVDQPGFKCRVKPEILVLVDQWTPVLATMSIQQLCMDPDSPLPVFDYLRLIQEMSLPTLDRKVLSTHFHLEHDEDGKLWLGLSDSEAVGVPMSCRLQNRLKYLFQTVYQWTMSFIRALLIGSIKYAWLILRTYPRESLIASVFVGTYYWYTTFKATKRQVIIDTAKMRDMALDKLRDASDDSHYVMALRDDVIADLTPYELNDKKRKYYRNQIWPRVMGQFVGDNRLRQSQHMDATKKQVKLYYQWVASKSAKKKAVRIHEEAQ